MSILKEPIDFRALEAELDVALKADELYKLQNDAKIRAIEQRVPTYDDFRHMVQAAHLRPLDKNDTKKRAQGSWNQCAVAVDSDEKAGGDVEARMAEMRPKEGEEEIDPLDPKIEPKTSQEFVKYWHRLREPRKKLAYLVRFQDRLKDKFFGGEVPTEFLEELFDCTLDMIGEKNDDDKEQPERVRQLLGLLELLGQCRRFVLNLSMIENKAPIDRTFERLYELVDTADKRQLQRFIFVASHYDILLVPKAQLSPTHE
ncbi:coiled-coil domain-containing protein 103 [Trichogramma pretiosum]|uniref:coiled-coil domain-containing protein 103 n=1 Tax=Trichogramma pretiosum TaxID=7493 RepID=UPI0006C9DF81|nr:coiled-coil domain-containing protein 103 [Trichogramma pretiosum]